MTAIFGQTGRGAKGAPVPGRPVFADILSDQCCLTSVSDLGAP